MVGGTSKQKAVCFRVGMGKKGHPTLHVVWLLERLRSPILHLKLFLLMELKNPKNPFIFIDGCGRRVGCSGPLEFPDVCG